MLPGRSTRARMWRVPVAHTHTLYTRTRGQASSQNLVRRHHSNNRCRVVNTCLSYGSGCRRYSSYSLDLFVSKVSSCVSEKMIERVKGEISRTQVSRERARACEPRECARVIACARCFLRVSPKPKESLLPTEHAVAGGVRWEGIALSS